MQTVTVHEAKTHLSRLLARVEAGEEIVIARGKVEIAKIVPLRPPQSRRRTHNRFADPRDRGLLDKGFWDPLPEEHLGLSMRDRYTP